LFANVGEFVISVDGVNTGVAAVAKRVVVDALVLSKVLSCVESFVARIGGTGERLGTEVDGDNVTLQSLLLSESLVTAFESSAAIFLMTLVDGQVLAEFGASGECLVATFPSALVIPDLSMCALDMLIEVSEAQVGVGAAIMGTAIGSIIGV
jgi:hypothetical protein